MKLPAYLWIFVPLAVVMAWSSIDFASRGFHWWAAFAAFGCIMSSVSVGLLLARALRKSNA
jgi:hypothetical protein